MKKRFITSGPNRFEKTLTPKTQHFASVRDNYHRFRCIRKHSEQKLVNIFVLFVGVLCLSLFCYALRCVHSSFAVILKRERKLVALL